jgi:hypothetical protein
MAQTSKFKLTGEIINYSTSKKELDVRVLLFQNGSQVKEVTSTSNGTYTMEHQMDITKTFEVVYQKKGFFSKKVLFNLTKVDPSKLSTLEPLDISMVPNTGSNELTFLETEPLQKITSIPLSSEDIRYRDNMQSKILAALSSQKKTPNPTNEIYDRGLNKAWDLLNEGKLDEAKKLAENYIVLNPKHPEPQKILAEVNRRQNLGKYAYEDTNRRIKTDTSQISVQPYMVTSAKAPGPSELKKMAEASNYREGIKNQANSQQINNEINQSKNSVAKSGQATNDWHQKVVTDNRQKLDTLNRYTTENGYWLNVDHRNTVQTIQLEKQSVDLQNQKSNTHHDTVVNNVNDLKEKIQDSNTELSVQYQIQHGKVVDDLWDQRRDSELASSVTSKTIHDSAVVSVRNTVNDVNQAEKRQGDQLYNRQIEISNELNKIKNGADSPQSNNTVNNGDAKTSDTGGAKNEIGQKYPEGITREKPEISRSENGQVRSVTETIYVVRNGWGSVYKKINSNGISSYSKDGIGILPNVWFKETAK